jgi:hypothetical protein
MATAVKDENRVPTLIGASTIDGKTPINVKADPTTGELLVKSTIPEGASFFSKYGTNDIEQPSSTITYIGQEDSDGNWVIKKLDTSSGTSFRYATAVNNPSITSYSDAWTNRATLTYGTFSQAF